HGSGPCAARCGGSSPLLGTTEFRRFDTTERQPGPRQPQAPGGCFLSTVLNAPRCSIRILPPAHGARAGTPHMVALVARTPHGGNLACHQRLEWLEQRVV